MIKTIEILIKNGIFTTYNVLIINEKKIMYMNDKKYTLTNNYLDDIINTFYLWNHEYGYDNKIDSEEFTIKVRTEEGITKYHGKGLFPSNYNVQIELLDGVKWSHKK